RSASGTHFHAISMMAASSSTRRWFHIAPHSLVSVGPVFVVRWLVQIGSQRIDVFGRSVKAAALVAVRFARQQAIFAPTLDCTLRNPETVSKLFGSPEPLLLQSLPPALELIFIAQPYHSIKGVGNLPVSAVPAFVQDRGDLNFGVRVEKLIDDRDDSRRSFTKHPCGQPHWHSERARSAATKSHVSGDDVGLNQSDILDEEPHDALTLSWLDSGVIPDARKIFDQRQQLAARMCVDEAPFLLGLLFVFFLRREMQAQLVIPIRFQVADDESIIRISLHVSTPRQFRLIPRALELRATQLIRLTDPRLDLL